MPSIENLFKRKYAFKENEKKLSEAKNQMIELEQKLNFLQSILSYIKIKIKN